MKKLYLLLLALAGFVMPAAAQHYAGFYLTGSAPLNGLYDSGYRNGVGCSFEYLSPTLFKTPGNGFELRVGAGFEWFHGGRSKKIEDVVFNTPNSDLGSVRLENQMFGFFVAPRFMFNTGKFSPYFDVLANARIYNSYQTNRFNKEVSGYERSTSTPVLQNMVGHYGGSVGVVYNLGNNVAFDARMSFTSGGKIKFVDLNSPQKNTKPESVISYKEVTANVSDILTFRIGVLFKLDNLGNSSTTHDRHNYINTTPNRPAPKPAEVRPPPAPKPNY